jgi:pantetheine-phosphate adenylyltransferase
MGLALYPGSFDPVHNGHLAVIEMATTVFDQVVVAVGHNPSKPGGLFTPDERMELLTETTTEHGNVKVTSFSGLVTGAAADLGAACLVKGIRSASDLDVEMLQANMNARTGGTPTVFLPALGQHALVSSRYVREIAAAGGDLSAVVPAVVAERLRQRISEWATVKGAGP